MMTLKTMITVPWWWDSRTRLGETILIFNVQICIKHILKQFILQEYYFLDMMNDFILTTISVIFLMQYHISLIKCCRPSNSRVKGKSAPITNNRWTKLPLEEGHRDSKTLKNAVACKQANQKLHWEANNYQ